MSRATVIRKSLEENGALIRVSNLVEAVEISNRVAPEHLELSVEDPRSLLPKIRNAGAIFVGRYSPEAIGDYCAGPNHVLPTSGTAKYSSPLGVYDFLKRTSVIECSTSGASRLGEIARTLAECEGLSAHARSAEYRIAK
jgi:Histidinol dehydrogenase